MAHFAGTLTTSRLIECYIYRGVVTSTQTWTLDATREGSVTAIEWAKLVDPTLFNQTTPRHQRSGLTNDDVADLCKRVQIVADVIVLPGAAGAGRAVAGWALILDFLDFPSRREQS